MNSVKHKVALITGATSGIGEACAYKFAKHSSKLILVARRRDRLDFLKSKLESSYNISVFVICGDISEKDTVDQLDCLPNEFQSIEVLINNAGTVTTDNKFHEISQNDIDVMLDTNVKSLIKVTHKILQGMVSRGAGHIINIGSIASDFYYEGGNVYSVTKHAVKAFTRSLRMDLVGTPIRVTQINPGATKTEISQIRWNKEKADNYYSKFTPLSPEDVAEIILYCCCSKQHINFDTITVSPIEQSQINIKPILSKDKEN